MRRRDRRTAGAGLSVIQATPFGTLPTGTLATLVGPANRLLDIAQVRHRILPLSDDLCGEVVQGGGYLLGGAPGSFKSGLALQLSLDLNRQGVRTLIILTEEPAHRLKDRALLMTAQWPTADVQTALSHLQLLLKSKVARAKVVVISIERRHRAR